MENTNFVDKNGRQIHEGMKLKGSLQGEYLVIWDNKFEFVILHLKYRFCEKLNQEIASHLVIIENSVSRLIDWGYL